MSSPAFVWLLLSLASTLAGNLTLFGSVADRSSLRSLRNRRPLRFADFLHAEIPVTIATKNVGTALLGNFLAFGWVRVLQIEFQFSILKGSDQETYTMKSRTRARVHYSTVNGYLATFSGKTRLRLEELRKTIKEAAPEAKEIISYNMPAYRLKGVLVYFAGYSEHIGFYPTSSPILAFRKELAKYKTSKGAVQFPMEEEIPKGLVKKIVRFRLREEMEKGRK